MLRGRVGWLAAACAAAAFALGGSGVSARSHTIADGVDSPTDDVGLVPAVRGSAVQLRPDVPVCAPGELVTGVDVGTRKLVAFTFDDGPWPVNTKAVMDQFEARGLRATFFMIGDNVRQFPDIARDVANRGHIIGNHSMTHRYVPRIIASEVRSTQDLIFDVTGQRPVAFRSPGLTRGAAIQDELRSEGLCNVFTTVVLGDHLMPRKSASELCSAFAGTLHQGEIVLLHDGGSHRPTVDAVGCMLDVAISRGYTVVTLPDLLSAGTHYDGPHPRYPGAKASDLDWSDMGSDLTE